ncbi:MAG: hypothetical protein ABJP02_04970 [Parasphingorhabdus sp.]|uniref:hypothetical protein n=1 Tax=Parasphingorhabdus sp. TaxID=2709688 RepID=UPI0032988957
MTNSKAMRDVWNERRRQIAFEGFTLEHDDVHTKKELAQAAACYAMGDTGVKLEFNNGKKQKVSFWPWNHTWWKPKSYRENLVRAGALIVAEIERLDRKASQ